MSWYPNEPERVRALFEKLAYEDGDKISSQTWLEIFFRVRAKYEAWVALGGEGRFSIAFGEARPADFAPRKEKVPTRRDR
jgi:hypothetical protein